MFMFFIYFFVLLLGIFIGIVNRLYLIKTINNGNFNKKSLLISSFIRILLVSLILFFIIKINIRFTIPLFLGLFLSKFVFKNIRIKK